MEDYKFNLESKTTEEESHKIFMQTITGKIFDPEQLQWYHQIFIDATAGLFEFKEYDIETNAMTFWEIFDGVADPDYVSYVVIDDENNPSGPYVTVDYIVGPKQKYHDATELTWSETEFDLLPWCNAISIKEK